MTTSERVNDRIKKGFEFIMLEALPFGCGMFCAVGVIAVSVLAIFGSILFVKRIIGQ